MDLEYTHTQQQLKEKAHEFETANSRCHANIFINPVFKDHSVRRVKLFHLF